MRLMKTFVIHLYIQGDNFEKLCGDLQMLSERKTYRFKTAVEMIDLLRQLAHHPAHVNDESAEMLDQWE